LDLNIESPLLVIPSKPEEIHKIHFCINLGNIKIKSALVSEPGRFIKFPDKLIKFMRVKVSLHKAVFNYVTSGTTAIIF
jgi:hypothetical protein